MKRVAVTGMCAAGHGDRIYLLPGQHGRDVLPFCTVNLRDVSGHISGTCGAYMYWGQRRTEVSFNCSSHLCGECTECVYRETILAYSKRIAQLERELAAARRVVKVVEGAHLHRSNWMPAEWEELLDGLAAYREVVQQQGETK